jgi:hypothetical protein
MDASRLVVNPNPSYIETENDFEAAQDWPPSVQNAQLGSQSSAQFSVQPAGSKSTEPIPLALTATNLSYYGDSLSRNDNVLQNNEQNPSMTMPGAERSDSFVLPIASSPAGKTPLLCEAPSEAIQ